MIRTCSFARRGRDAGLDVGEDSVLRRWSVALCTARARRPASTSTHIDNANTVAAPAHRPTDRLTDWPLALRHTTRHRGTSRHEVARSHCDRRPRHCCMSHSDELPSANALSALQHHLSGTLSLSLFRTVTCSRYLNLDLKHICSPPSLLPNCPVRQRLWSHGNMALYKFCIVLYCFWQGVNQQSLTTVCQKFSNRCLWHRRQQMSKSTDWPLLIDGTASTLICFSSASFSTLTTAVSSCWTAFWDFHVGLLTWITWRAGNPCPGHVTATQQFT